MHFRREQTEILSATILFHYYRFSCNVFIFILVPKRFLCFENKHISHFNFVTMIMGLFQPGLLILYNKTYRIVTIHLSIITKWISSDLNWAFRRSSATDSDMYSTTSPLRCGSAICSFSYIEWSASKAKPPDIWFSLVNT